MRLSQTPARGDNRLPRAGGAVCSTHVPGAVMPPVLIRLFGNDLLSPFRFTYAIVAPYAAAAVVLALFEGGGVVAAARVIRAQAMPLALLGVGALMQVIVFALMFMLSFIQFSGHVPAPIGIWLLTVGVAIAQATACLVTVVRGEVEARVYVYAVVPLVLAGMELIWWLPAGTPALLPLRLCYAEWLAVIGLALSRSLRKLEPLPPAIMRYIPFAARDLLIIGLLVFFVLR